MQELNLSDGLYTPAQAAAVPSFLAADQRLDSIGTGPYYWSSRMRLKECDYMVSSLDKLAFDVGHGTEPPATTTHHRQPPPATATASHRQPPPPPPTPSPPTTATTHHS